MLLINFTARVGKSSLTIRLSKNNFSEKQESTVDATHIEKDIEVEAKKNVKLMIWDTAG
tara:strand:- start:341 stop:517 length:177 start_codon:yes stop_codon:yes gene_type:complete